MTLALTHTAPSRAALDWRHADDDVLVATLAGEFAGFVNTTPLGAHAFSARGEDLGVHDSRESACAAVAASAAVATSATRPSRSRRISALFTSAPYTLARHPRSLRRPEK